MSLRARLGRAWRRVLGKPVGPIGRRFDGGYVDWRRRFVLLDEWERRRLERAARRERLPRVVLVVSGEPDIRPAQDPLFPPDRSTACTPGALREAIDTLDDGDLVLFLRHDDALLEGAAVRLATAAVASPDPERVVVYADEEWRDGDELVPYFKPAWSPDLFCSLAYPGVCAISVGLVRESDDEVDASSIVAESLARADRDGVRHVPRVLVRRERPSGRGDAVEHAAAVAGFLALRGERVTGIEPVSSSALRVRFAMPDPAPHVTIVIPSRDRRALLERCTASIRARTEHANYEILLVDNDSRDAATLAFFADEAKRDCTRVISHPGPFNFAAINNRAAASSRGELLLFLNDDTEVDSAGWLTEMASQATRPTVGAVGALLLYPDDTIQHAGVICGLSNARIAGHVHRGIHRDATPLHGSFDCVHDLSAVTGACLMVRRSVFDEVRGFDESFAVCYNDVDLCLRIAERGYRNVWTPHARLYHHENVSRAPRDEAAQALYDEEARMMRTRHATVLANDPAHNPNLALEGESWALAERPRLPDRSRSR